MAAWALGRIGDLAAIAPLRQGLNSPYPAIRVQAVRALAALGDIESVPVFLERQHHTEDKGLQMAYAAALGKLQAVEATPQLLETLGSTINEGARFELALSLARMIGDEGSFVDLLQQSRKEIGRGTALAQKANTVRKMLQAWLAPMQNERFAQAGDALAREDLQGGAILLSELIFELPLAGQSKHLKQILQASAAHLGSAKRTRVEFIMLALHALQAIQPSVSKDGS